MQITYSVTPDDVAVVYKYNWSHSPQLRRKLYLRAIFIAGAVFLIVYIAKGGKLNLFDTLVPILAGALFLQLLPYLIKRGTKTQPRKLTIDPGCITTEIGGRQGTVLWSAVGNIGRTDTYIFITGKSTNAFVIPQTAFANEPQRNKFFNLAQHYHRANNEESTA